MSVATEPEPISSIVMHMRRRGGGSSLVRPLSVEPRAFDSSGAEKVKALSPILEFHDLTSPVLKLDSHPNNNKNTGGGRDQQLVAVAQSASTEEGRNGSSVHRSRKKSGHKRNGPANGHEDVTETGGRTKRRTSAARFLHLLDHRQITQLAHFTMMPRRERKFHNEETNGYATSQFPSEYLVIVTVFVILLTPFSKCSTCSAGAEEGSSRVARIRRVRVLSRPLTDGGSTTDHPDSSGVPVPAPAGDLFKQLLRERTLTRTEAALYYLDNEDPDSLEFMRELRGSTAAVAGPVDQLRAATQGVGHSGKG